MVDLVGGQVDIMFGSIFIGEPQVKAGKRLKQTGIKLD